ncbi:MULTISPECIES: YggT family protein [Brevibacterium]|uniref:YggT family protein n=1 Tax=Brevibacterium salitolerans TaxID=1403566 RepID=A0ABN2X836_9MICO|nr:YggT family protein [Brevibacterium sp.]
MLSTLFVLAGYLLSLYVWVLLARVVLDLIQVFSRDWRPTGFLLVVCEFVYTLTDPPVRLVRKVIPPLRLGGVALDLGFIVVFIGVQFLAQILFNVARVVA